MSFAVEGSQGLMVRMSPQNSQAGGAQVAASQSDVNVRFEPAGGKSSSPLDQIGTDIADTLRGYAERRTEYRSAIDHAHGPASGVDQAKQELLSGPASLSPAAASAQTAGPAREMNFPQAMEAMARTFDYAVETQLIVQSSSKVSSSATALLRAQ